MGKTYDDDPYNRGAKAPAIGPTGPSHAEGRHMDNMYAHFGNNEAPPPERKPTILEKTLIGLTKMDPDMAAETAKAMTVLMGRVMDQQYSSGDELAQKQKGVVQTFLFDKKASPATLDVIMQTTVEAVTGEPYKAPTSSAPTVNPNAPKVK